MNRQEWRLFMERISVLVNGIAGAIVGFCSYMMLGIILIQFGKLEPVSMFQFVIGFIVTPIVFSSVGFYLAVRKDWWIMKRRW